MKAYYLGRSDIIYNSLLPFLHTFLISKIILSKSSETLRISISFEDDVFKLPIILFNSEKPSFQVTSYETFFISAAHSKKHIDKAIKAFQEFFATISYQ